MPFFEQEQTVGLQGDLTVAPAQKDIGFGEAFSHAWKTENSLGSAFNRDYETFEKVDGYSAFDDELELEGYELYADAFVKSESPQQTQQIKKQIDKELESKQLLAESGWTGALAGLAAGITDPVSVATMFIPGGAIVKGAGMAKVATTGALAGGAGVAATELALHQSQETRTVEESLVNTAAGAVLAGGLSGAAQAFFGKEFGRAVVSGLNTNGAMNGTNMDELAQKIADDMTGKRVGEGKSVGAAAVKSTNMNDESMRSTPAMNWMTKATPGGRLAHSTSLKVRQFSQELISNNWTFNKTLEGKATSQAAETKIQAYDKYRVKQVELTNSLWTETRKAGNKISKKEFNEMVGQAMRRGDKSDNPQVQTMAQEMRKHYDYFKEELQYLELLPEDVKTIGAETYLNRAWNFEKITSDRTILVNKLADWVERNSKIEAGKNKRKMQKLIDDGVDPDEFVTNPKYTKYTAEMVTRQQAIDAANEMVNKIVGAPNGVVATNIMPEGLVGKAGILKSRTLNIPDSEIEEFLESDIEFVFDRMVSQVAPEIELTKAFGNKDLSDQILEITEEYNDLIMAAKTPKERKKLEKQRTSDLTDLEAMRDRLLGTYGAVDPNNGWIRASKAIRTMNFITMLGGMTLSAIPDLGRTVMQHGLKDTAKSLADMATASKELKKLRKEELKDLSIGLEYALSTRMKAMSDLNDPYKANTKFERGLDVMANNFGNLSLMNQWNDVLKNLSGTVIQSKVIRLGRQLKGGKPMSKSERADMAKMGFEKQDLIDFYDAFKLHGEDDEGLKLARSDKWDDIYLKEKFQTGILSAVNNAIVTPGAGDTPLTMSGPAGKVLLQFKTFLFASTNRVAAAGFQQRDASFYTGLVGMVGLGALAYQVKAYVGGREPDNSPANLLKQGIDRSGVLGLLGETNNMMEKVSGHGLSSLMGVEQSQRFQSRSVLGTLIGPTGGKVEQMVTVANGLTNGEEWKDSHTTAVRRMIPYNNLFYLNGLFNKMEEAAK